MTGLWHLEHTGSDLAKQFVAKLPPKSLKAIRVGIWDASLHFQRPRGATNYCKETIRSKFVSNTLDPDDLHGHMVASLLSGPFGPIDLNGKIDSIVHASWEKKPDLPKLAEAVEKGLRVVNYSIGAADESNPLIADPKYNPDIGIIDALDKTGIIVVAAAGNSGQKRFELNFDTEAHSAIIVGSIDPRGWRASVSQNSTKRTVIFAPGETVVAEKPTGQITTTEGTSFAAPQVSGVITLALQLLPELSRSLIEEIIWFTGLDGPQGSFDKAPIKILNSYKFIRVIQKLAEKIEKQRPVSQGFVRNFLQQEIKKESTFNDSKEALRLLKSAEKITGNDCKSHWEKLNQTRMAYFLNPSKSTALLLSDLYDRAGYVVNGEFFKNLKSGK